MANKTAVFTKDTDNKKLTVVRSFDAALKDVWHAWTTADILDQWWAPKPYRAETKIMDFKAGGQWLYNMVSPEGAGTLCRVDYETIETNKSIESSAKFCDENGNVNKDFPVMYWKQSFAQAGEETTVTVEISFTAEADMEMIIKMGFEAGFTMGLNNLQEYLAGK